MTTTINALLPDPGVVRVAGEDAAKFLQGLITNDMERLASQSAIHAALLTPQGKILFAFFVLKAVDGFLLETPSGEEAGGLVKRLGIYKLRAKVTIDDVSQSFALAAFWDGDHTPAVTQVIVFGDPRHPNLGGRMLLPKALNWAPGDYVLVATEDDYHGHRIRLGVPEAGRDYRLGDTFPHEADFDLFNGVDFDKGCYVGQEIVARMQHKSIVRKRVVRITGARDLPASKPDIKVGDAVIGSLGSVSGREGLALLRLDRVDEAINKGQAIVAGDVPIEIEKQALERYRTGLTGTAVPNT